MSLTPSQQYITDELFVRTADENYIAARWCAVNRLHTDFAWLAVHSLEKYLKAVLLYNGAPTKKQGHDITRLYEEVKPFVGLWLPAKLVKPPDLEILHWFERTPEQFLQHLYNNGNPDNRYLIFGHDTRAEDLHMLDDMVFAIRRLICTLDSPLFRTHKHDTSSSIPTNREMLSRQADYRPSLCMPLDDLIRSKNDDPLRSAALNLNLAFAPDFPHMPVRGGDSSRNPAIRMQVLDLMKRVDQKQVDDGVATARWLLNNVRLPGEDQQGRPRSAVAKQVHDAMIQAESSLCETSEEIALGEVSTQQ